MSPHFGAGNIPKVERISKLTRLQSKPNFQLSRFVESTALIVNAVGEVDASLTLVAEQWLRLINYSTSI